MTPSHEQDTATVRLVCREEDKFSGAANSAAGAWSYSVTLKDGSASFTRGISVRRAEAVVERVAGATHRANRIGGVAAVDRLAQASDVDIHRALVDIDIGAPHAVEQLLA